jgi:hypothetical protein
VDALRSRDTLLDRLILSVVLGRRRAGRPVSMRRRRKN